MSVCRLTIKNEWESGQMANALDPGFRFCFKFFLAVPGLHRASGFSLVVVFRFSLQWLLFAEHRLVGTRVSGAAACGLSSCGSQVF